jgi:hypothetical protein
MYLECCDGFFPYKISNIMGSQCELARAMSEKDSRNTYRQSHDFLPQAAA